MNFLRTIQIRFRALFQKRKLDTEMDEEMRSHVELRTQQNIAAGMSALEAGYAARRQFGWAESIKEDCRDQRGARWIESLVQDIRYGSRMLRKNPGFTAVAVLSLSLGIAANTTIFSFVNALLFRPPSVEAPGELWQVWRQNLKGGSPFERYEGLSYPGYSFFRTNTQSFSALAAFDPETPFVSWNRDGVGQTLQCQFVSGDFFQVCRVKPLLGRMFVPEEDRQAGADSVTVISYSFWKNHLGKDPQIVGRLMTINGVTLTVIGVAPAGFTGLLVGLSPDLWAPFMMRPAVSHDPEWHTRTGSFSLFGVGRLKSGVTAAQAQAELTTLTRRLEEIDPGHYRDFAAAVFPSTMVPTAFRGYVTTFTAIFMGAVFMVLVIACANAANLMLARAVSRRRELQCAPRLARHVDG